MENIHAYLGSKTEKELRLPMIHDLPSTMPLEEAFELLNSWGIRSAPVYEVHTSPKKYIGFLDASGVARIVAKRYATKKEGTSFHEGADFRKMLSVMSLRAAEVVALSRDVFKPLTEGCTLLEVLSALASGEHHVPIVSVPSKTRDCGGGASGEKGLKKKSSKIGILVNIITQSALLKFIWENAKEIHCEDFFSKPLNSFHTLEKKKLLSIGIQEQAIQGFRMCAEHGVSAIALVGADGKLCGNLSITDLYKGGLPYIHSKVGAFLLQIQSKSVHIEAAPMIVAHWESTLSKCIERVLVAKIHRIYIEDRETRAPIGIVSMTDLMHIFYGGSMSK